MFAETKPLKFAREFVEKFIADKIDNNYCYHNLEHTIEVVEAVKEVGEKSELNEEDMEITLTAAWLHDIGYQNGCKNHEQESIKLARKMLIEYNFPLEKIEKVIGCIEATKIPQKPKNVIEKVICDADMYHLSTDQFFQRSELLKNELNGTSETAISDEEWLQRNIEFMKNHSYFTNYAQLVLTPRKEKNLKKLKKKSKKTGIDEKYLQKLEKELLKLRNKVENDKLRTPTRGIETMFRITSKNHLTLSGMADNKANIMISVNAIILSVLVSVLFRKLEDSPNLLIPGLILTFVCLTTIVFAILATRPNVSSGTFTEDDIHKKRTNLLFFGNFHNMKLDNYLWGMREMMKDSNYLYGSLIKDIYFLGIVLGKKYQMLRTSYTIFMFGFILAVISFIFAAIFPNFFTL